MKIKVIFLDIDGVCNGFSTKEKCDQGPGQQSRYITGVEPSKVALIKKIVDATGAKIVLSSSWRAGSCPTASMQDKKALAYLCKAFAQEDLVFYDYTPFDKSRDRGAEIQEWLDCTEDEVEDYIVIDDQVFDIIDKHRGHVLVTSEVYGLKPRAVDMAIKMLGGSK